MSLKQGIVEFLRDRIERGKLKPGEDVPSEHSIAGDAEFLAARKGKKSCSRGTVRAALKELEREGFVRVTDEKRRVVATREKIDVVRLDRSTRPLESFGKWLERIGKQNGWKANDRIVKDPELRRLDEFPNHRRLNTLDIATALGLEASERVFWFGRIRLANTLPLVMQWTVLPEKCFDAITRDDIQPGGMKRAFNRNGLKRTNAKARYAPIDADLEESIHLQIEKGAPLMEERRISTGKKGAQKTLVNYEYTITLYTSRITVTYAW